MISIIDGTSNLYEMIYRFLANKVVANIYFSGA